MSWFCPAFMRPERLAYLAESWEEHCAGTPLHVRVWKDDPEYKSYMETGWPEEFQLYVSDKKSCGEALQEFAEMHPNEPIGFIGEDCVVRTPNAANKLQAEAGDWYLAWPNDTIQRWGLSTHFCIGPLLLKALKGVLVPKDFPHHYLDTRLRVIADNCGLERYRPDVIFQHMHYIKHPELHDKVYAQADADFQAAGQRWEAYRETLEKEIHLVRMIMVRAFEKDLV